MNTDNENLDAAFERLWRDFFCTFPPMDTMSREEREKLKDYTRQVYLMGKYGRRYYEI